jgi:hypothetical protein
LFGTLHYFVQGVPGVEQAMITGLVFGTIFAFTGSIFMLMVAHAAFDLLQLRSSTGIWNRAWRTWCSDDAGGAPVLFVASTMKRWVHHSLRFFNHGGFGNFVNFGNLRFKSHILILLHANFG